MAKLITHDSDLSSLEAVGRASIKIHTATRSANTHRQFQLLRFFSWIERKTRSIWRRTVILVSFVRSTCLRWHNFRIGLRSSVYSTATLQTVRRLNGTQRTMLVCGCDQAQFIIAGITPRRVPIYIRTTLFDRVTSTLECDGNKQCSNISTIERTARGIL